jgi:hypothetical protein
VIWAALAVIFGVLLVVSLGVIIGFIHLLMHMMDGF